MIEIDDYEFRLISYSLRPDWRDDSAIFLALAWELMLIPDRVKEELLGHIRLQWWRDQINQGNLSDSPLMPKLVEILNRKPQLLPLIMEMIDGFAGWLSLVKNQGEASQSFSTLEMAASDSFGRIFALMVAVQNHEGDRGHRGDLAIEIGRDYGLARMISTGQIPSYNLSFPLVQSLAETLSSNHRLRRANKPSLRGTGSGTGLAAAELMIARRLSRLRRAGYDRFAVRLRKPDRLLPLLLLSR